MARLASLKPRVATIDTRVAQPPPKTPDPFYLSKEWRSAVARVKRRDGYRCVRAECPTPDAGFRGRLIVNHVVPRKAGGSDADSNLETLCPACDNRFHREKGGSRGPAAR